MTRARLDRDTRRRSILDAAVRVLARKGWSSTRMEDIAAEAGVAKGTVFLSFPSRDEVIGAIFADFEQRMTDAAASAAAVDGNAATRLVAALESLVGAASAEPELARVVPDLWAAGVRDATPAVDLARIYDPYRRLVDELLQAGAADGSLRPDPPEQTAAVVVAAVEGLILQWIADPAAVPLEQTARPLVDVLLRGLAPEGSRP